LSFIQVHGEQLSLINQDFYKHAIAVVASQAIRADFHRDKLEEKNNFYSQFLMKGK